MNNRKLDALVHHHIFHKEIFTPESMHKYAKEVWRTQPDCAEFLPGFTWDGVRFDQNIPYYSTDLKDAWKVFEEYMDPNRHSIHPCGNGAGLWWAIYYDDDMVESAANIQLAICFAGLKQFGVAIG